MHVMLQARGLWDAVKSGTDDYTEDRMVLEVITKVVPPGADGHHGEQSDGEARVGVLGAPEHRRGSGAQGARELAPAGI
jgi:hypothetical protein